MSSECPCVRNPNRMHMSKERIHAPFNFISTSLNRRLDSHDLMSIILTATRVCVKQEKLRREKIIG